MKNRTHVVDSTSLSSFQTISFVAANWMSRGAGRWCRRMSAMLLLVFLALPALLVGTSVRAQAIRLVSAPGSFYGDDKQGNGILNNYAAYAISNNTAVTLPSVYVAITNINSTNLIQLAASDPGVRFLGVLAPGQVKLAAFYLRGPSLTGSSFSGLANETHTIQVRNAPIGFGGSLLASANFSFTNINYVLEASANKVTIITNLNPQAVLGSLVPLVIGGQSGTIGSPPTVELSPAVFDNWRPDAYQLERTLVTFDQNPSYTNLLYFDASTPGFTNYANNNYTNTYYFRASKVTGTNVPVSPFGFIASGTQIKHTALSSLSALGPTNSSIMSVTNGTIIGHTVSPATITSSGGTVTYSIIISNISSSDVQVDRMVDVLPGAPANVTFVNNSATYNAVALTNPVISGQTLTWNLPFAVTANSTSVLTFQATVPATAGLYTNSVTGIIGLEQIDTTFDTADNSPSLTVLGVGGADLAIAKSAAASVLAGANLTYTISVTNLGPSSASSVTVTDTLPANVTFVSASGGGVNNSGIATWSLGTLANGQVSNVTLTVTAPASGTLTNTASVASPTTDSNSTNNVTPPVITSLSPVADLAIGKSGPALVTYGNNFNYTISVTNFGPSTASGILATDTLPANLVFIGAVPAATTNAAHEVIWSLTDLASGAGTNLTLTVNSLSAVVVSNTAKLGSPVSDPNPTNNITPPVVTTVGQATPLVTWTNPESIVYGTSLGTNQNNATANVGGTFTYNPTNGTVLPVGTNTLTVLFTPGNTNYALTNASVRLVVTPAPLTITANSTAKIYGQTVTFAGTEFTVVGLTNGDSVSSMTLNSAGAAHTANVGSYSIIPSAAIGSGLANYAITYSTNGTLTVSPTTLGITADNTNRLYNTSNPAFTYTASGFVNGETASVLNGSPSLTTTAILSSPAGVYPILTTNGTLSATNYVFTFTNGVLTVNLAAPVVVWPAPTSIVYGTPLSSLQNNATSSVPGTAVYNPPNGAVLDVGTNTLSVVFTPTDTNYASTNLSVQLVVTPAPLAVTVSNLTRVYGQPNPVLGGTISGLQNSDDITATYATGATTNSPVGGYLIVPTLSDPNSRLANYSLTTNNGTLTVLPAVLGITANDTNRLYGAANPVFTYTASGFVNGDTASVLSGSPGLTTIADTNSPVGTYPIAATNGTLSATNYAFNFTNGTLTVLGAGFLVAWPNPAGITYGTLLGTNENNASATVAGSYVYTPTNGTLLPAGTNTLSIVFTPTDTNYASTNLTVKLVVTPAPLTVTASNQGKIYGAALNLGMSAFTSIGLVNGESIGSVTLASVGAATNAAVGTYAIVPSAATGGTFNPANYSLTYSNGTLTVSQAVLMVTANSTNKIYGAADPAFTASYSGFVNGENSGVLSGLPSLTTTATTNSGVSVYPISATNGTLSAANYSFAFVNGILTVNAATLTITANDTNRLYNTANPTFTYTPSGFVNGETASVLSGSPSLTTPATISSPGGSYPINATNGTLSAANYNLSFASGTLTIIGGSYGITWTNPVSIVYGTLLGTNQNNASATVAGSYDYNPTNGTLLPAGTNILSVVFTPSDTNYATTNVSVQLVVTPAPLTITAGSTNKPYNTTLSLGTTAFTSSGLVNSETIGGVTLTSTGTVASAPVGTYPITASNATGGTFNPSNYSLTYSNGTLTVLGAGYTATWPTPTNIVYGTALGTNENNASASIPGAFTYNPTNGVVLPAGTNTLTVLFTPTDTNYATTNLSVPLIVTPAPLIITADSTNKVYGTTLTLGSGQTAFTSSGLVNGDSVTSVTLASAGATGAAPVGTYPLIPSDAVGSGLTNYSIGYSNGTLAVVNGAYSITWTNPASIVYGTPLGTNENNASATIPGGYVYNPTNGVVLPVGTNTLTVVFTPADTNYASTNLTVSLVVTPAALTVTANDAARVVGQPNPVFTGILTGVVNGDNITATYATTATTNSPAGPYPIVPSLVDPNSRLVNYSVTTNNGTLTITNAPLVADLVVVQSGPTSGIAGSNLTFTVSVTNRGPQAATSVIVSNQLASGFTFVSASAAGANSGGVVTWNFASLPVNGVTNLTVTVFAAEGGAFTNIASGASGLVDTNSTNNDGSQANAKSHTIVSALADVAIFKVGETNGYRGSAITYTITATNAGPSTATNVVVQDNLPAGIVLQSASGSYTATPSAVTWSGLTIAPGTATNFSLSLVVTSTITSFTNIAFSTSSTADPVATNNNGSSIKSRVTTKVSPSADVVVLLAGPPSAVQGSNFVYTLTVTNAGPSTSSNIVVSDSLPLSLLFVSASSNGKNTNNIITWPVIKSLPVGGSTNYTLTVKAPSGGVFTNIASALAVTHDPNATNNSGVSPASQALTTVAPAQLNFLAGTPVFNPQTGLFEENVTVTNIGSVTILGFRMYVGGLTGGITLYNATGTANGVPYVDYIFPLDPSNHVTVTLELFSPMRVTPTNSISVEPILPSAIDLSSTNRSVAVSRVFTDTRNDDTRFVIEFASVPGKTYNIIYSSDLVTWKVATPSVTASSTVTQWYDDGPPKTESKPASVGARFYRVIKF